MAKDFGQRPAKLLAVHDEWAAYCLDSCVSYFGSHIEGKLSERDKKGNPVNSLESLLADADHFVDAVDNLDQLVAAGLVSVRKSNVGLRVGQES